MVQTTSIICRKPYIVRHIPSKYRVLILRIYQGSEVHPLSGSTPSLGGLLLLSVEAGCWGGWGFRSIKKIMSLSSTFSYLYKTTLGTPLSHFFTKNINFLSKIIKIGSFLQFFHKKSDIRDYQYRVSTELVLNKYQ